MNARLCSLAVPLQRLRIQVEGAKADSLLTQTLASVWVEGQHSQDELLGRLACAGLQLENTALERITWALLCWPGIDGILLFDERAAGVVARLSRMPDQPARKNVKMHLWRDTWFKGEANLMPARDDLNALSVFPPHRSNSGIIARMWGGLGLKSMLDTSAEAVAGRERTKLQVQRVFGRRMARLAQNVYQWSAQKLRQAGKALPCPADAVLPHVAEMSASHSDNKIAVLIMVPRLDPGGAEKNIMELALRLWGLGARVHMMTTIDAKQSWAEKLRDTGVELFHLADFLPTNCWFGFLRIFIAARRISHLHIMNSHWAYEHLPDMKRCFPEIRVITHLHAEGEPGTLDFPALAARYDACVDVHSVISEHLADYMQGGLGVVRQKVRVIRTGIDSVGEAQSAGSGMPWRVRNGVPADTPVVIFVGRFSELKRPLRFIEIAQRVLQYLPETLFVLKGQGPLEDQIRRRLAAVSPSLSGQVLIEDPTHPVAALMADADLLVLPSLMEGIAYVSYEAMAQGLPQVYADVGGQSELLSPETGIAVTPGPEELEAYVDAVLMLLRDPKRRRQMGTAARSRIAGWPTADDTAASYLRLYREFLQR